MHEDEDLGKAKIKLKIKILSNRFQALGTKLSCAPPMGGDEWGGRKRKKKRMRIGGAEITSTTEETATGTLNGARNYTREVGTNVHTLALSKTKYQIICAFVSSP